MTPITEQPITTKKGTFPANIIDIIDNNQLVLDRGKFHGLKTGRRVLVYCLSDEEIINPNTGESFGYLEVVKGTGKIMEVNENTSLIQSDELLSFDNPQIGDKVKPI